MPTDADTSPDTHRRSGPVVVSAVAAFLAGTMGAVQSRANGTLATTFASPIDAALWSFGSGWVLLALAMLHPVGRRGLARARRAYRDDHLRWWQFLGGLGGGFFVVSQTWSVPQIGVALFTIAVVGGQTANALLVDGLGLGPAGKAPVTLGRVLGAAGTFAGVALAMVGRGADGSGVVLAPVLLSLAAGAGMAVQQAINGRVQRHAGTVLTTTWINFTWGTGLIVGVLLAQMVSGSWAAPRTWDAPWWAFVGGLIGIAFVAVGAVVVHHLGVLFATLLTLAGQLLGAVVVDLVAARVTHAAVEVTPLVLVGVAVTLVSAVTAAVAGQRARRRPLSRST